MTAQMPADGRKVNIPNSVACLDTCARCILRWVHRDPTMHTGAELPAHSPCRHWRRLCGKALNPNEDADISPDQPVFAEHKNVRASINESTPRPTV